MPATGVLDRPVQYLKGIGPKRAQLLARIGIGTLRDLLDHLPRTWEDRRECPPGKVPLDGPLVLKGRVKETMEKRTGSHLSLFIAKIVVPGHGDVDAIWFKRPSLRYDVFDSMKKDLTRGVDAWFIGRGDPGLLKVRQISVDEYYIDGDPKTPLHVGERVPIYATTQGLPEKLLREAVSHALTLGVDELHDFLPKDILDRRELLALPQAIRGAHRPRSAAELEESRRRLAYEELLLLELAWTLKQRQVQAINKGYGYEVKRSLLTPFRAKLGFEFTGAQKRVINEIMADMMKSHPMTRLLQGDVGSGKTVVAVAALLLVVENGYQGALMAPTEILAEQHYQTILRMLEDLPVKVELLTSRVAKKSRARILERTAKGEVDLLLGTHALLQGDVRYKNLRLAVIDEQHRFGVRQRTTLRQKGPPMDLLVMTATPIPRTLSLALYGDLDVSTVDEMPPGRTPIQTDHVGEEAALTAVKEAAAQGRQSYIVYPIIEESANLDLKAAMAEHERLSAGPLHGLRVGLVHGRLPSNKKMAVMDDFAAGKIDALVATPVIEVGVDVPNAVVMVIQNADRFGLASLHQLRGRIGRGEHASRCCLVCDPKTPEARRRVAILCETNDGFRVGEEDLKIRGPGEILGTDQHGELSLRAADLVKDADLLAMARADAEALLTRDADMKATENLALKDRLDKRYHERWKEVDLA